MKITELSSFEDFSDSRKGILIASEKPIEVGDLQKGSDALKQGGWSDQDFAEVFVFHGNQVFVALYNDDAKFPTVEFSKFVNNMAVRSVFNKMKMQVDLWPAAKTNPVPQGMTMSF